MSKQDTTALGRRLISAMAVKQFNKGGNTHHPFGFTLFGWHIEVHPRLIITTTDEGASKVNVKLDVYRVVRDGLEEIVQVRL